MKNFQPPASTALSPGLFVPSSHCANKRFPKALVVAVKRITRRQMSKPDESGPSYREDRR